MSLRDFLLNEFDEDHTQRPEFDLGFQALRTSELRRIADKYSTDEHPMSLEDENLDMSRKKASAVDLMTSWWNQGWFPQPTVATLAEQVAGEMSVEMLQKALADKQAEGVTGTKQLNPDLHEKPAKEPANEVEDFTDREKWPWPALQSYAAGKGMKTQGMKRHEIENQLMGV